MMERHVRILGIIALSSMFAAFIPARLQAQVSPHGPLSLECTSCHSTTSWKELISPMKFDHATTNFPLQGRHVTAPCRQCHASLRFAGTASACFPCHQDDYKSSQNPPHALGQFSHECIQCHTLNGWRPSTFDHAKTDFQLIGAHKAVECEGCHTANKYAGLTTECKVCHQKDYAAARNPNHQTNQYPMDCLLCHSMNGWRPSNFNHAKTDFPLTGAHVALICSSCHGNGKLARLPSDCINCHQNDYANSKNPDHRAAQFPKVCMQCHTTIAWRPSAFDHGKTNFPLTGAHRTVECSSCHTNGRYAGLPIDCYSCHQADFAKVATPNHATNQFSHDCTTCHTNVVWKPSTFDHAKTTFPLTGGHVAVQCASCHTNGRYAGLPTDCYSCHQTDFANVVTPNHLSNQFSHDCTTCHSNVAWKPSTFDHAKTTFPLTGGHVAVQCASCHTNGRYVGLPTDCYSCHQADFAKVATPNHVTSQFSHDCLTCHTTVVWKPSTFDHVKTIFPLTGAHITTDCIFCHKNGQYQGLPSDCWSCHQADYTKVTDPNHVTASFDHNCTICHSTTAWNPATFDHAKTIFPLSGAHIQTQCSKCHVGGKYAGTTTDCGTCHLADYNAATNPNHAAPKFPLTCVTCHTTIVWSPSTFDHTPYFPIAAGSSHRPGRWNFCTDCHTAPTNFKLFSCITCHEHNQTSMNSSHSNVKNYLYDSNQCYKCHPRGSAG
jgi:predicted CXXCH cytochrome family protein